MGRGRSGSGDGAAGLGGAGKRRAGSPDPFPRSRGAAAAAFADLDPLFSRGAAGAAAALNGLTSALGGAAAGGGGVSGLLGKQLRAVDDLDVPKRAALDVDGIGKIAELRPRPETHVTQAKSDSSVFTGLANQGSTCYLNSLLQALFMTPEFRQLIYSWQWREDVDEPKQDCIPFQLQQLFGFLQLSTMRSVTTKSLTRSFGWDDADSFVQHDTQELCRILLAALEESVKGTANEGKTEKLFQGMLRDCLLCRECGTVHGREDPFLDVPLVVQPFGSAKVLTSIDESIKQFLAAEALEGSNQYFCDVCDKKVDAAKGLKFHKLPYIMMLTLKRFTFDYATMNRVKLNSRVSFPFVLDMNGYVDDEPFDPIIETPETEQPVAPEGVVLESSPAPAPAAAGTQSVVSQAYASADDDMFNDDALAAALAVAAEDEAPIVEPEIIKVNHHLGFDAPAEDEDGEETIGDASKPASDTAKSAGSASGSGVAPDLPPAESLWDVNPATIAAESGPLVYELYAVLVHSGGAMGGHYFAYIKNMDDGQWYNFNDSSVTKISATEVCKAFGGAGSTNAYVLLYRQYDPDRNVRLTEVNNAPEHVQVMVDEERQKQIEREEAARAAANTCRVQIWHNNVVKPFTLQKTASVIELLTAAWEEFGLNPDSTSSTLPNEARIPLTRCRLRAYNKFTEMASEPYASSATSTLDDVGITSGRTFLLETRAEGEEFPIYDPNAMPLRIIKYDAGTNTFLPEVRLMPGRDCVLAELRLQIEAHPSLAIPPEHQRLMKVVPSVRNAVVTVLVGDNRTLVASHHVYDNQVLYLEEALPSGPVQFEGETAIDVFDRRQAAKTATADNSPAVALFESNMNQTIIQFNALGESKPTLSISIDRRLTVEHLRARLAEMLHIAAERVQIRMGNATGRILRSPTIVLGTEFIVKNNIIHVSEGMPIAVGEYCGKLFLEVRSAVLRGPTVIYPSHPLWRPVLPVIEAAEESSPAASVATPTETAAAAPDAAPAPAPAPEAAAAPAPASAPASAANSPATASSAAQEEPFRFVGDVAIKSGEDCKELRARILQTLIDFELVPKDCALSRIRVRRQGERRLGAILYDGLPVGECLGKVWDGIQICVQVLDVEDTATLGTLVLETAWWDRATWTCGPTCEIVVKGDATFEDLGAVLCSGSGDLSCEHLSVTNPKGELNLLALPNANWVHVATDSSSLDHEPFHLVHGDLLIVTDLTVELTDLDDEARSLRAPKRTMYLATGGGISRFTSGSGTRDNRGVRIKSREEKQKAAAERQAAAIAAKEAASKEAESRALRAAAAPAPAEPSMSSGWHVTEDPAAFIGAQAASGQYARKLRNQAAIQMSIHDALPPVVEEPAEEEIVQDGDESAVLWMETFLDDDE